MNTNRIVRAICCFAKDPSKETLKRLDYLGDKLSEAGFEIQNKRVCSPNKETVLKLDKGYANETNIFSIGSLTRDEILNLLPRLAKTIDTSFNLDLTDKDIEIGDAQVLFEMIKNCPGKTFAFSFVFNNPPSAPFFPSGNYSQDGFAIGFQPTDLSENCKTLEEWLEKMKSMWDEAMALFKNEADFLGIDSSIAPLFAGKSSLISFMKRLHSNFSQSTTTDTYLKIANFIKNQNPKPIGLCGIMFPCLEDFELAKEYEKGNFSIERNVYLSLHSGLGIDTYPIGVDENPERVLQILKLTQGLSNKYKKPLSIRFVSDGKTKIGEKSNFNNQYLKDVAVRSL